MWGRANPPPQSTSTSNRRSGATRVVGAQTRTTEPPAGGVPQVAVVLTQHARRAGARHGLRGRLDVAIGSTAGDGDTRIGRRRRLAVLATGCQHGTGTTGIANLALHGRPTAVEAALDLARGVRDVGPTAAIGTARMGRGGGRERETSEDDREAGDHCRDDVLESGHVTALLSPFRD